MMDKVFTNGPSQEDQSKRDEEVDTEGRIKPLVNFIDIALTDGIGEVPGGAACHDVVKKGDKHYERTDHAEESKIRLAQGIEYPTATEERKARGK